MPTGRKEDRNPAGELNLSALVGKSVEAKERRLVPEVVEDFFTAAAPIAGVHPTPVRGKEHVYRVGKVPKTLSAIGERLEPRFGNMGRAWVLPHPEREAPGIAPMVSDPEIEKIAVRIAMERERARGWVVESVENENRGYDLLSKRPHPSEPGVFVKARFIGLTSADSSRMSRSFSAAVSTS